MQNTQTTCVSSETRCEDQKAREEGKYRRDNSKQFRSPLDCGSCLLFPVKYDELPLWGRDASTDTCRGEFLPYYPPLIYVHGFDGSQMERTRSPAFWESSPTDKFTMRITQSVIWLCRVAGETSEHIYAHTPTICTLLACAFYCLITMHLWFPVSFTIPLVDTFLSPVASRNFPILPRVCNSWSFWQLAGSLFPHSIFISPTARRAFPLLP